MDTPLDYHPIAAIFPLLSGRGHAELVEDIRAHGLHHPIMLFEDKILDGRNRYRACLEADVESSFEVFSGTQAEAVRYVWSENFTRRHLDASQRAAAWKKREQVEGSYEAELKRQAEAEAKKSYVEHVGRPKKHEKSSQIVDSILEPEPSRNERRTAAKRAQSAGTNRQYMAEIDFIHEKKPELVDEILEGKVSVPAAVRDLRRVEYREKLEDIRSVEVKTAQGVYDVIVIDPPWPMQKIERDVRPNQSEFDYPTMTEEELAALSVPMAEDCHVWLWTTHRFLPIALRLLDTWKLRYVCTFVWHKPGGFQPMGLPQYNCEFALYARRGNPQFLDTQAFSTCFTAGRGRHSEKPEAFYEMVRRVTAGRRLDMFSRRIVEGFGSWGNEAL
jgi:N6-adenosine-specific RNA methylase IME4/ParB-like chromosome segregation protein Spo0J